MALAGVCPASERRPYRRPKYACCRNQNEALTFVLWGLCLSLVPMGGAITSPGHHYFQTNLLKFLRVYLSREIVVSHIPYTICRSGTYYYNRRVPNTQSKPIVCLSDKLSPNALQKRKLMQNVWVMYWRDLGVGRQRECS